VGVAFAPVRGFEEAQKAPITLMMKQITGDLVSAAEFIIAHLSAVNVHPFAGMPV